MKRNQNILMFTFSGLLVLCFLSLLYSCSKKAEATKDEPGKEPEAKSNVLVLNKISIKETGIETIEAKVEELHGVIKVPAKLLANQDNEAQVGSLVQGRVQKVFVRLGDRVSAGQPLMSLASLEVGEIQSQYLKAHANLEFAESALNRQKVLNEQNVGSRKSLLEAQAEYDKAFAEFQAEDKKIHSIGLSDEDVLSSSSGYSSKNGNGHSAGILIIKSPISGVVVERNIVVGQLVDASTNAFRIIEPSSIWADGQVYEKDISKISGNPEVKIRFSSFPDEVFTGKISYIGQIINEQTRTIPVRAVMTNPGNRLKPQMFGDMEIPIDANSKGIMVPLDAVFKEGKNDYVFIDINNGRFEKRAVKTGISNPGFIEITNGINPGEKVVSKGAFFLKSEMLKSTFSEEE